VARNIGPMSQTLPLTGRTIGVTADRRGDDQQVMFGRLGAEVVLGPTISTVKLPDPALLRRRTEEIIAAPPDYVIANTGVGVRTWMAAAAEWALDGHLRDALDQSYIASRGPKATGGLGSFGLAPQWRSPTEQLGEVVEHLKVLGVSGKRVALQLHGDDCADFVADLETAGAEVTTVPVYVWEPPPDPTAAMDLIERTCAGGIDAVTFTAAPQARSLIDLAGRVGRAAELLTVLNGAVVVGCIGPVCAAGAAAVGIDDVVQPANWRLGSLVKAVAEALSRPA